MVSKKQNCWEYMKCGREPGGEMVAKLGTCRAATDEFFNGMNGGKNGGRICLSIAGTFSKDVFQCSCLEDLASCKDCSFFKIL